jgi:hypothetical protein
MNRIIFKWLPVLLVLTGCSLTSPLFVSHISNMKTFDKNTILYALPVTVINVDVDFLKTRFIPGPYHEYTGKYLSLEGVSHDSVVSWQIRKITVSASVEPDPGYFYSVRMERKSKEMNQQLEQLAHAGFVMLPGSFIINGPFDAELTIPQDNEIYYTDLSVKRNIMIEKETSYKRVLRDSVYVQIPVATEILVEKEPELKAEEAASFIIKLRKRRFKLLTGQSEGEIPDGAAGAVIQELNWLEQEYLSLFTGRTIYESETRHYRYIPVPERRTDQQVLFKISDKEGAFDAMSAKGRPVILDIECQDLTRNLNGIRSPEAPNMLYYRYPDLALITITLDNRTLFENRFSVYQYGPVVSQKVVTR